MKGPLAVAGIVIVLSFVYCPTSLAILTGQYLFEEGTGTTALDTSGFGRNGTLTDGTGTGGPSYTTGLYKGSSHALLFKQTLNDRVALPQGQNFIRNATGATLMAWVRYDSPLPYNFDTQVFPIIVQVNDGTTVNVANGTDGSRASITDSHNFFFRSVAGQLSEPDTGLNSVASGCQSSPELCTVTGRTYFVVGVFDYVNRSNTIYIDGVLANTTSPFPITSWTGGNSDNKPNLYATIGANPSPASSTQFAWDGAIDGVRIFDTALDATTILNIYNAEVIQPILGDYNNNGVVDAADYVVCEMEISRPMEQAQMAYRMASSTVSTTNFAGPLR